MGPRLDSDIAIRHVILSDLGSTEISEQLLSGASFQKLALGGLLYYFLDSMMYTILRASHAAEFWFLATALFCLL